MSSISRTNNSKNSTTMATKEKQKCIAKNNVVSSLSAGDHEEAVLHFRALLVTETKNLDTLAVKYEDFLRVHEEQEEEEGKEKERKVKVSKEESPLNGKKLIIDVDEDVKGSIRSAVGLARLLVSQRFKQFSGLIDSCAANSEPRVTCEDLCGFWDGMVEASIRDIKSKFQQLDDTLFGSDDSTTVLLLKESKGQQVDEM